MIHDPYDLGNGFFEVFGGVLAWLNSVQIYKDKGIKGINWWVTWFFTAWGCWNLFYYPHLKQSLSFAGAFLLVFANAVWLYLVIKYRRAARDALSGPVRRA